MKNQKRKRRNERRERKRGNEKRKEKGEKDSYSKVMYTMLIKRR